MVKTAALLLVLFLCAVPASAQEKTGIVPFKVFGPFESQSLKDAIPDMLFTRLPQENKEIVRRDFLKDALKGHENASELDQAKKLMESGSYGQVVMGSYTKLGNAFSIDMKFLRKGDSKFKSFYASRDNESKVFEAIEDLSEQVAAFLEGRTLVRKTSPQYSERKQQATEVKQDSAFKEIGSSSSDKTIKQGKIFNVEYRPVGICVGDLDADGKNEIVVADSRRLYAYRFENEKLTKLAEFDLKAFEILAVDCGDFNKNGRNEVYAVTLKNEDTTTQVFELKGREFDKVYETSMFVRVMNLPGEGAALVGQRSGSNDAFVGDIFRLDFKSGVLVEGGSLGIKRDMQLFQIQPVKYTGQTMTAYFDDADYLRIMNDSGKVLERLKDRYGGTPKGFFKGLTDTKDKKYAPLFLRMIRIEDGETDALMLIKNEGNLLRYLTSSKVFDSGKIVVLRHRDGAYREQLATDYFERYLTDIALDQKEKKLYAVVITEGKEGKIFVAESPVK